VPRRLVERLVDLGLRAHGLQLLRRDELRVHLHDVALALVGRLRLHPAGLGLRRLRARRRHGRLRALHRGLRLHGVDLQQELPLGDHLALHHREAHDAPVTSALTSTFVRGMI
jgi:hypothetical protein